MKTLKDYHPIVSLVYFLSVLILTMMTRNPIWVVSCFIFALIYFLRIKGLSAILLQFLYFIPMLVMIVVINSIFNGLGLTVLFYLGEGNPITLENIMFGVFSALALFNVFLWFSTYNSLLTSDEILSVLGHKLPTIGLALSMIIKYIPDTLKQGKEILLNQKSMLGKKKLNSRQKLKFGLAMLTVLLSWSMENALETADSMRAKGYPSKTRISYSQSKFNPRDLNFLIIILGLLIIHIVFALSGSMRFTYYPFITWQGKSTHHIKQIFTFVSLGALLSLPLANDFIDWIRWHIIQKKELDNQEAIDSGIVIYEYD
ncbi:MAG TPA: energy-coupling factor transporter transmembrane component T [Candidatus Eisenbacteria bacterium]|nr:energy-coupling factor transporter transmembrane component T [Candidatus Eisenbacteria bacterium]